MTHRKLENTYWILWRVWAGFAALCVLAACSSSVGAGDSGSLQCAGDKKCCDGECLRVECRFDGAKCACASVAMLDNWFAAGTPVVASCEPMGGGVCCSDSNGWCDCTSGKPTCGYEGQTTISCAASDVMFCGHGDGDPCL